MDTNKYFALKVPGKLLAGGADYTQATIFKYALVRRALQDVADKFDGEIVTINSDGKVEEN